jgi:hypothetical protein
MFDYAVRLLIQRCFPQGNITFFWQLTSSRSLINAAKTGVVRYHLLSACFFLCNSFADALYTRTVPCLGASEELQEEGKRVRRRGKEERPLHSRPSNRPLPRPLPASSRIDIPVPRPRFLDQSWVHTRAGFQTSSVHTYQCRVPDFFILDQGSRPLQFFYQQSPSFMFARAGFQIFYVPYRRLVLDLWFRLLLFKPDQDSILLLFKHTRGGFHTTSVHTYQRRVPGLFCFITEQSSTTLLSSY